MNQNTSVESSTHSSTNQSINPVLQAALSSLDVQLEEELARYRRQRAGHSVSSPRGLRRHQTRKPLDLISIEQPRGQTQQRALGMSKAPVMSFPLAMGNQTPAAEPPHETTQETIAQTSQLDARSSAISEPGNTLVFPLSTKSTVDNSGSEPSVTQLTSPRESAGIETDPLAADQAPPDDYLESSEKLLQSLSEEEETVQPEKRSPNRLLTPLALGSILLVLLSSATLVYLVTNRSLVTALGLDRLFGSKTPDTSSSPTETTVAKGNPSKDAPIANGPNLATEEFVDLNLDTLSHLQASPTPSASPSPIPTLPDLPSSRATSAAPPVIPNTALPRRSSSSDLSSALLPPAGQQRTVPSTGTSLMAPTASSQRANSAKENPSSAPTAPATTQKPQVSSSQEQATVNSASAEGTFYYVLINDTSDRTLVKAKTFVPDAYVETFPQGARIQMGAFKQESEAKTLIKELQQQGISATIYRP
jgi:hypothetical protein